MIDFIGESGETWSYDPANPLAPPGGFGTVFGGTAPDGSEVAVKVISLPPADPAQREVLLREVKIGQRITEEDASQYLVRILAIEKLLPTNSTW